MERILRTCEAVIVSKEGHFDESKIQEDFCVFSFNLYLIGFGLVWFGFIAYQSL